MIPFIDLFNTFGILMPNYSVVNSWEPYYPFYAHPFQITNQYTIDISNLPTHPKKTPSPIFGNGVQKSD